MAYVKYMVYYVKSDGTGSGTSETSPWSLDNLRNTVILQPGDEVRFGRGDVLYGSMTPQPGVTYSTYGTGAQPIFTGFTQLTQWTKLIGSIYYATLDVPALRVVTLDNIVTKMGRWPKSGYNKVTSHTGNTSITDSLLTAATNWAGAEIVMRKLRWVTDRHIITNHTGSTLTYSANQNYGNATAYEPVDGNGYFIQGHLATLTALGDWHYNAAEKRLYMHFGTYLPAQKTVKVVSVDQIFPINTTPDVTFNNIDVEGGNYAALLQGAININFNNCNLRKQGDASVYGINSHGVKFNGGSISDTLNMGIWGEWDTTAWEVNNMKISNIGTIEGAGRSGDGSCEGVAIRGDGLRVRNNIITGTGYNGISFYGSDVRIEKNYVENFCLQKDDGAGIYTYTGANDPMTNRVITGNTVKNAKGKFAGVESYWYEAFGKAAAIYLDGYSHNTEVSDNTLVTGEWAGVFINNNKSNQVKNNLVINFAQAIYFNNSQTGNIRLTDVTGNTLVALTDKQQLLYIKLYSDDAPQLLGVFDNNTFVRATNKNTVTVSRNNIGDEVMTLAEWQAKYGQDIRSAQMFMPSGNAQIEVTFRLPKLTAGNQTLYTGKVLLKML